MSSHEAPRGRAADCSGRLASNAGRRADEESASSVRVVPCVAAPSGWGWPLWFGRAGTRGLAAEATSAWPALSTSNDGSDQAAGPSSAAGRRGDSFSDGAGYVYRTVVSKECFLENRAETGPIRRCEVLRRTFRQCAGRPVEELESVVESFTEDQFRPESPPRNLPDFAPGLPFSVGQHGAPASGPLPGDLPPAKLFEDFFQLARDVQQGMEQEAGYNNLQSSLSSAISGAGQGAAFPTYAEDGLPAEQPGLFGWLFGSGGGSPARELRRQQQQLQATYYKDYERGFQDI